MKTGIVKSEEYLLHTMGNYHPESPKRLEIIYEMIEREFTFNEESSQLVYITPREATEQELASIHTPSYINLIKSTQNRERVILDPDTSTCAQSYHVASLAAGGVLEALEAIMAGKVQNAFAFVRPPGHHAEKSRAMGFCLFNNIAIGAEYLIAHHNLKRILIIDWDLHHGNGTQNAFFQRADVLYFSTHQYPYYPGTGSRDEVGTGEGEGYTVNVPLTPGKGDGDFLYLFTHLLAPIAEQYKPQFILVSCGFDICSGDPLGGMRVSSQGFGILAQEVKKLADKLSEGKLLFVLEGGYDLHCLREGTKEILAVLSNKRESYQISSKVSEETKKILESILKIQSHYWKLH